MIWVLFSIDNNYDQPDHNMVYWWDHQPSLFEVAVALDVQFPAASDQTTLAVVSIWDGKHRSIADTRYRLECLKPGRPPAVTEGRVTSTGKAPRASSAKKKS